MIGPHAPVLLGFDRGGAYPVTFTACRDAGAHWVTYRRAPLAETTAAPKRSWTVRDGKRITVGLADETVQLTGYGQARQLTLFEHDQPVLQVLTSDTHATGADLLCWLRSRWRIENMFKYACEHNGIDALADYQMDIAADPRMVTNPARVAARARVYSGQGRAGRGRTRATAAAQRCGRPGTQERPAAQRPPPDRASHRRAGRREDRPQTHPSQDRRDRAGPGRQTSLPPPGACCGLQMVLRLLAFNAEAWLAERFNAYLADNDEYRAITRHLLHLGGQVEYSTTGITVTLDRPDTPRIARALNPAHRRAKQHARAPARRPPPPHLPGQARLNLNGEHIPTWGGLRLDSFCWYGLVRPGGVLAVTRRPRLA